MHGIPNHRHSLLGNLSCPLPSLLKYLFKFLRIFFQILSFLPVRGKSVLEMRIEIFFAFNTADVPPFAVPSNGWRFVSVEDGVVFIDGALLWAARIILVNLFRVGIGLHHFLLQNLWGIREEDVVVQGFGHLLPIRALDFWELGEKGFRFRENLSIEGIKPSCNFPGEFEVGDLILPNRDSGCPIDENVGSLKDWISQKSIIHLSLQVEIPHLLFQGWISLQPGKGNDHTQKEIEFGVFWDVRLDKDGRAFWIKTGSNPVDGDLLNQLFLILCILIGCGQGVPIGDLKEAFILVLQFYPIL